MTRRTPLELSEDFARAFCAADIDRVEALLAEDFSLKGTLFRYHSRADYITALRRDPPERGQCNILEAHGSIKGAAVLYEHVRSEGSILIAQFTIGRDIISEMRLVFDPTGIQRGG